MGGQWDPECFVGDPSRPDYQVDGLKLAELSPAELAERQRLLAQVERSFDAARRGPDVQLFDKFQQQAFDLLTSGKAREALIIMLQLGGNWPTFPSKFRGAPTNG